MLNQEALKGLGPELKEEVLFAFGTANFCFLGKVKASKKSLLISGLVMSLWL